MSEFTDSAQSKQIDQQEHNHDAQAKRVVIRAQDPETGDFVNLGAVDNGDGSFGISSGGASLAVRIDDTSTGNTTYIGKAPIGSATSSAVWQIQKLDETSGLIKTWADGDANYNNIWDNRVSISYT